MDVLRVLFLAFIGHVVPSRGGVSRVKIEGDIVVTPRIANVILAKEGTHGSMRAKKRGLGDEKILLWKFRLIPYKFSNEIDEPLKAIIRQAFDVYKKNTCIKFQERKKDDRDYVEFIVGEGCYSSVGRQEGKQVISLGEGCDTLGHALHEIMHTLGFFHEQSRMDRDLYVKILWWNIIDGAFRNFATYNHGSVETLDTRYDIHSILHYGNKAFTKNGDNTIESLENPKEVLGRNKLSTLDIKKVNKIYKCLFRRNKH